MADYPMNPRRLFQLGVGLDSINPVGGVVKKSRVNQPAWSKRRRLGKTKRLGRRPALFKTEARFAKGEFGAAAKGDGAE